MGTTDPVAARLRFLSLENEQLRQEQAAAQGQIRDLTEQVEILTSRVNVEAPNP